MLRDWLLDVFGLLGSGGATLPPATVVFRVLVFVLRLPAVCLLFVSLVSCVCPAIVLRWSCALLVFVLCSIRDIGTEAYIYMYICVRISVHPSTNVCVLHLNPAPVALRT